MKNIALIILALSTSLMAMQQDASDQAATSQSASISTETTTNKLLISRSIPVTIKTTIFVGSASLERSEFFEQIDAIRRTMLTVGFSAEDTHISIEGLYAKSYYDEVIHFSSTGTYSLCSLQSSNKRTHIEVKVIIITGKTGRIALIHGIATPLKDYYTSAISAELKKLCLNDFNKAI